MSISHEMVQNNGPEQMTLERARENLKDQILRYGGDHFDDGITLEELETLLLSDTEGLQIYVDTYNKIAWEDWQQERQVEQSMTQRWLDEGGADVSDQTN